MTERKKLKKQLSDLKRYKSALPRLIDCSDVYGYGFYNNDDLINVDEKIALVEMQIAEIDKLKTNKE